MTKIVWRKKREPQVIRQEVWVKEDGRTRKVASYKSEAEIQMAQILFAGRDIQVRAIVA